MFHSLDDEILTILSCCAIFRGENASSLEDAANVDKGSLSVCLGVYMSVYVCVCVC